MKSIVAGVLGRRSGSSTVPMWFCEKPHRFRGGRQVFFIGKNIVDFWEVRSTTSAESVFFRKISCVSVRIRSVHFGRRCVFVLSWDVSGCNTGRSNYCS